MIQFENTIERFNDIILDELKKAEIKCWIAGGALRDYFMGEKTTFDYDLFFPNNIEFEKAKNFFNEKKAEVKYESDNGLKVKYNGKIYDLVKKYFLNPQATIDAFDFTISMIAVDSEKVYFGDTTFIDLAKRQLMINKITYPASTLSRAFKYYKKGFTMCHGEMKKLVESIQYMPKKEENENTNGSVENENNSSGDFFVGID